MEADQSYSMVEVNHLDKRYFDKYLASIASCNPAGFAFSPNVKMDSNGNLSCCLKQQRTNSPILMLLRAVVIFMESEIQAHIIYIPPP